MKIKDWVYKYYAGKQPNRQAVFPKFDQVRSVLILFESDPMENNSIVKTIAEELQKENKDVVLWGYCKKKEILSSPEVQYRILGLRSFNLFGTPKKEVIVELQKRSYDLLIDLSQKPSLPLRYLAMLSRADFKTGMDLGHNSHDFLIRMEPQNTPYPLYSQIIKYLTLIKTR